ncbi:MAG: hypothetical protein M1836_004995 [Candelina mexicana]|nr:MAG: hypothetical protein M1836_004995 [Candelina mexicana]
MKQLDAQSPGATPTSRKRKRLPDSTSQKPKCVNEDAGHSSPSITRRPAQKSVSGVSAPRKSGVMGSPLKGSADTTTNCEHKEAKTSLKRRKPKATIEDGGEEKRLRRFRSSAPKTYQEKLERAVTQRMFVIGRTRRGTPEVPEEAIDLAGTTGNIYQVTIGKEPMCTCPDNQKGNQCKHIIYVLVNVLKAPDHLRYQLAFVSSELREIFAHAPAPLADAKNDEDHPGKRKPIEGPCPVCFLDLEADTDDIVWCKAACGNNIHKHCFEQWAASQRGKEVKCVYCRTLWQGDVDVSKNISTEGILNEEGYVNVADQLGLSGRRDYSSYHQYWVRRTFGDGY